MKPYTRERTIRETALILNLNVLICHKFHTINIFGNSELLRLIAFILRAIGKDITKKSDYLELCPLFAAKRTFHEHVKVLEPMTSNMTNRHKLEKVMCAEIITLPSVHKP